MHENPKFEKLIGKKVRVTFHGGHYAEGILTHRGWRYAMDTCEWYSANDRSRDRHISGWFCFCHSNVKKIEEI